MADFYLKGVHGIEKKMDAVKFWRDVARRRNVDHAVIVSPEDRETAVKGLGPESAKIVNAVNGQPFPVNDGKIYVRDVLDRLTIASPALREYCTSLSVAEPDLGNDPPEEDTRTQWQD